MLLKLIKHQRQEFDKIYLSIKDQLLINGREKVGFEKFKNPKAFDEYSQIIDNVYEN